MGDRLVGKSDLRVSETCQITGERTRPFHFTLKLNKFILLHPPKYQTSPFYPQIRLVHFTTPLKLNHCVLPSIQTCLFYPLLSNWTSPVYPEIRRVCFLPPPKKTQNKKRRNKNGQTSSTEGSY